jgi:hypothetical protein
MRPERNKNNTESSKRKNSKNSYKENQYMKYFGALSIVIQ